MCSVSESDLLFRSLVPALPCFSCTPLLFARVLLFYIVTVRMVLFSCTVQVSLSIMLLQHNPQFMSSPSDASVTLQHLKVQSRLLPFTSKKHVVKAMGSHQRRVLLRTFLKSVFSLPLLTTLQAQGVIRSTSAQYTKVTQEWLPVTYFEPILVICGYTVSEISHGITLWSISWALEPWSFIPCIQQVAATFPIMKMIPPFSIN